MITLEAIESAAVTIEGQIVRTPLVPSRSLSSSGKSPVFLKLENQQTTGSFKLRGASNAISRLREQDRENGIVCVSTGNHGRGLAHAARQNGLKAIVCMGKLVPQNKIDGIKALGAEVRIVGDNQEDAQIEADRLVREEGMTMIPPFDHLDIIAGQGTIGLEIVDELDEIDTVIVPMSGGGLLAGVASAVKMQNPEIRVIGVSMERGCAMHLSLAAGEPVEVDEFPTLADALGGGIGIDNQYTLKLIQEFADETVLVSEQEIADAIRHAYFEEQQIVEGSGTVGIAALLADKVRLTGNTVVVVSGKNIDMKKHQQLMNGHMPEV
jgi:threonine dehydratase